MGDELAAELSLLLEKHITAQCYQELVLCKTSKFAAQIDECTVLHEVTQVLRSVPMAIRLKVGLDVMDKVNEKFLKDLDDPECL